MVPGAPVRSIRYRIESSQVKSQPHQLDVLPGASFFSSLSLNYAVCKMGCHQYMTFISRSLVLGVKHFIKIISLNSYINPMR